MEGRTIAGRYQLLDQLGQSATGSVWRAFDRALHVHLAIKLVNPATVSSQDAVARAARRAAMIHGRHIVSVLDVGNDQGTLFIVMELAEGEAATQCRPSWV